MTLAALITSCRILGNDTPTSNLITLESPIGTADGTNTKFRLQYQNIVSASVYISYGTTFRTNTGFTVDLTNGILTFSPAPANATALIADYNYYWFTDTDWTDFLGQAAQLLGSSTDPTTVAAGLIQALEQFALYYYFMRRATQYANKYASSGGQAAQQVDSVTKNFLGLANAAMKNGNQMRADFYTKKDAQMNPASATATYQFDPMSPRR